MRNSFLNSQIATESFAADDAAQPEAPLWSWLEAHDVPFRVGPWVLEQQYKAIKPYPTAYPVIELPQGPWQKALSTPWSLNATGHDSPALPDLHAEIYGPDWRKNFTTAMDLIEAQFGPADRTSRTNAKSAHWTWGKAALSCMVWPPEENTQPNGRHDALPHTVGAARITIKPAWRPPVASAMKELIGDFACIHTCDGFARYGRFDIAPFECRGWAGQPDPGLWGTPDSPVLLLSIPDRPVILPRHRLSELHYYILRPARGAGELSFGLRLDGPTLQHYTIGSTDFSEDAVISMRRQAQALARDLGLTFAESDQLNV